MLDVSSPSVLNIRKDAGLMFRTSGEDCTVTWVSMPGDVNHDPDLL